MTDSVKSLGRGLDSLGVDALLSKLDHPNQPLIEMAPIEKLKAGPYQPRKTFHEDSLRELSVSIKQHGILQPILVQSNGDFYEIIAGERRYQASILAELTHIPVIVKSLSNEDNHAIALIENIQRENLNAIDEAHAYAVLIEHHQWTHQEIAERLGRSRSAITNSIRLLQLNSQVQIHLKSGKIDMGHARALLPLSETEQQKYAEKIISESWSVRETETQVNQFNQFTTHPKNKTKQEQELIQKITKEWTQRLNRSLKIKHLKNGSGSLSLSYQSLADLQSILNIMKKHQSEA